MSEFGHNHSKADGLDNYCRSCRKEYNQQYYKHTKERHNPARAARRSLHKQALLQRYLEYMLGKSCSDCGENDVVVLEFDHLRDKIDDVSNMMRMARSWSVILEEIAKCDIVCANCHRRRTARTRGWHKGR